MSSIHSTPECAHTRIYRPSSAIRLPISSVTTKTWKPANGLTSHVGRIPRRPPLSSPPRSLAPRAENWIAQLRVILTASVDRFAAFERADALQVRLSFLDDLFSARGRAGPPMVRGAARLDVYSRRR